MNALKSFSDDGLNTCESHPFSRPIPARALAIVRPRNDNEWLRSTHVGFDGFPHSDHLALGLKASK